MNLRMTPSSQQVVLPVQHVDSFLLLCESMRGLRFLFSHLMLLLFHGSLLLHDPVVQFLNGHLLLQEPVVLVLQALFQFCQLTFQVLDRLERVTVRCGVLLRRVHGMADRQLDAEDKEEECHVCVEITHLFSSVQFKIVSMNSEIPYALHPVSQKLSQRCL